MSGCWRHRAGAAAGRHRHLEPTPRIADSLTVRDPAVREAQRSQRMWSRDCDAFDDSEPGCAGRYNECGDPFRSGAFAAASEHRVEVGGPSVADPGLLTVENPCVAIATRPRRHRARVGARLGFGDRERRDVLTRDDRRQEVLLLLRSPEQRDRAGPQSLHREREVGESGVARQQVARQAKGADVEAAPV